MEPARASLCTKCDGRLKMTERCSLKSQVANAGWENDVTVWLGGKASRLGNSKVFTMQSIRQCTCHTNYSAGLQVMSLMIIRNILHKLSGTSGGSSRLCTCGVLPELILLPVPNWEGMRKASLHSIRVTQRVCGQRADIIQHLELPTIHCHPHIRPTLYTGCSMCGVCSML